MLKRIQRLWKLTKKDPRKLDLLIDAPESVVNAIPDEEQEGVFFPEPTQKDFEDQQAEDSGMKEWLDRLKRL